MYSTLYSCIYTIEYLNIDIPLIPFNALYCIVIMLRYIPNTHIQRSTVLGTPQNIGTLRASLDAEMGRGLSTTENVAIGSGVAVVFTIFMCTCGLPLIVTGIILIQISVSLVIHDTYIQFKTFRLYVLFLLIR